MHKLALALALVLMVLAAMGLALFRPWWFTPLASNWGALDRLIVFSLAVTGLAYLGINLFLAYVLAQRAPGRAAYLTDDRRLEGGLITLTTLGIVLLLAPGLYYYAQLVAPPRSALQVEVLGQQWIWAYRYPGPDGRLGRGEARLASPANPFGVDPRDPAALDDVVVLGGPLHLPLNQPVLLLLRANDAIHNFYVPEFRVKMDAVPGMVTRIWFTPTRPGSFQVLCAEYCGLGHSRMVGQVQVEPPEAFAAWLEAQPTVAQLMGQ
ncbi:cytochrome c oxidase subunit II [Thermus oshimai]|jgi:cytochrome c oxidase subunit 2|uniref:cytochrome c oxidase subunit II n=1 Tax=Thermus TaxID=270 RepID=UPI00037DD992|nr:hypothetical protein [Thermus oshimai]